MDYLNNIQNADKLMIIAHPDDETFWASSQLFKGGYFVVCMTNARNKVRSAEFKQVLELTGNTGYMFEYSDGYTNWRKKNRIEIQEKLTQIIQAKDWQKIVTHNSSGEYGHPHHKNLNKIVVDICLHHNALDKLHHFGTYYSKRKLAKIKASLPTLDNNAYIKKQELISIYKSQTGSLRRHGHMMLSECISRQDEL